MLCVALRCRDYTGPKPCRLFSPYLAGFARRPCHPALWDVFRVSQNVGQNKPPLADASEMVTANAPFKHEIGYHSGR
jgi:hypothetical protein